jgi:D-serine deaminase-like pyridoxal phosphate-dependent protein
MQECKIERLCELNSSYPDAWIATIVSRPVHVDLLASTAARRKQTLRVMIDLDAGMHRTGIRFGPDAAKLYAKIDADTYLKASGLHLYDGHQNFSDVAQREAAAQGNIESLKEFQQQVESAGMPVDCVVAGGSYSFSYYARTPGMYGSPGTFIYWDTGFSTAMPDMPFRWAALILTQVVDRYPDEGMITTDLGCKAISTDLLVEERACLLGQDAAQLILQDEEHGVFRMSGELPGVGDYLLAVPGHVCPTTIRYPGIHVINTAGDVVDYYLHTARDR